MLIADFLKKKVLFVEEKNKHNMGPVRAKLVFPRHISRHCPYFDMSAYQNTKMSKNGRL
jgi:hypothetical protein